MKQKYHKEKSIIRLIGVSRTLSMHRNVHINNKNEQIHYNNDCDDGDDDDDDDDYEKKTYQQMSKCRAVYTLC